MLTGTIRARQVPPRLTDELERGVIDKVVFAPKKLKPRSRQEERNAADSPAKSKRPNDELAYFEIDRFTIVRQLQNLRRAMEKGAEDMEMVAAERVFVKSLSGALERRARQLHRAAKDLNSLLRSVARANIPR